MRRITESFTRRVLRLQTRRGAGAEESAKAPPRPEDQAARILTRAEETSARFAIQAWQDFWADFRPDETEVEVAHYRQECADLQSRLDALPAGALPDAALSSAMIKRVLRLRRDRFQDLSERIDDLASSHHAATGRYEKAALNGAQHQDDIHRVRRRLLALLDRLGITPPADEPVPALLERLIEAGGVPAAARSARLTARTSGRRPSV
jgi:hypothetical protein